MKTRTTLLLRTLLIAALLVSPVAVANPPEGFWAIEPADAAEFVVDEDGRKVLAIPQGVPVRVADVTRVLAPVCEHNETPAIYLHLPASYGKTHGIDSALFYAVRDGQSHWTLHVKEDNADRRVLDAGGSVVAVLCQPGHAK